MLYYRIYSVFCFLGWFVLFVFLVSHPLFRCRYVTVVCLLLPDSSVLAHISRLSRMCRTLLVFRFLPAFLRLRRHCLLRYRYLFVRDDFQFAVQDVLEDFIPPGVLPVQSAYAVSVFWVYFAGCVQGRLFSDFSLCLKYWVRNKFSVYYFSGIGFYSTFGSAYGSLDFILEFSF